MSQTLLEIAKSLPSSGTPRDSVEQVCKVILRAYEATAIACRVDTSPTEILIVQGPEAHSLSPLMGASLTSGLSGADQATSEARPWPSLNSPSILYSVRHTEPHSPTIWLHVLVGSHDAIDLRVSRLKELQIILAMLGPRVKSAATSLQADLPLHNPWYLLHRSLDVDATGFAIANETRRNFRLDRTTVFIRKRGHLRVLAISGQTSYDTRGKLLKSMRALVERIAPLNEPFWYPRQSEDYPQLAAPLAEYLDQAHSRSLAILPLYAHHDTSKRHAQLPVGWLVMERFSDPAFDDDATVELMAREAGVALSNAWTQHELLLLPLRRYVGKLRRGASHIRNWIAAVACVTAALTLVYVPSEFQLHAPGSLQPTNQQHIYAPLSGIVTDIHVSDLSQVDLGTPLLQIRSSELDLEIEKISSEVVAIRQDLQTVRSLQLASARVEVTTQDPQASLASREQQVTLKLANLEKEQALLVRQRDQLSLTAPLAGCVTTWDIERRLLGRPVNRGERLLTVADTSGTWELELQIPERKLGELLQARMLHESPPSVQFVLSTDPERRFVGQLTQVDAVIDSTEQNSESCRARVALADPILNARPGASVQAKIACGQRPLGYVWFSDVIAFWHRNIRYYW